MRPWVFGRLSAVSEPSWRWQGPLARTASSALEVTKVSSSSVVRQPLGSVSRRPASGTLAEVVDLILDKGLVIDAYVRVSLIGIELLTVDVRVVVASVDTYLHFAEATNRLDLRAQAEKYETDLAGLIDTMRG
jgi:hypothetical protein